MILCFWVALGSALGGVARYGFGIMAGRLWGEAFPWGTIAINIVGSFVIGFFAALTMPQGALPASPGLRSFVMVGLCGGFTTFSSFSLQTLSLARDGNWFAALGNVLLSVALCLMAVALGQSAGRIGAHPQASGARGPVLAILDRPETARPVLAAAKLAADWLGGTSIEVLHLPRHALEQPTPGGRILTDRLALQEIFRSWRRQSGIGSWREQAGGTATAIGDATAGAGLVVLGCGSQPRGRDGHGAVPAALFEARRTMLLVPEIVPVTLGRHVAVAWKPGEAALPMLLRAGRVTILIGDGDDDGPARTGRLARLEASGVAITVRRLDAGGRAIGTALLAEAHAVGADLLVLGACAPGEVWEFTFAGETGEIPSATSLPVLLHR